MRRFYFLTLAIFSTCLGVFAQGKIRMENDANHLVYLGFCDSGEPIPTNSLPVTLLVDLYGGTSASAMTLQTTVTMSTTSPGRFGPVSFISPNLPGGSTATMQIKVRESTYPTTELAQAGGGYYGYSQIFTMKPSAAIAYNSIVNAGGTSLSTWANGSFNLGAAGLGAIQVITAWFLSGPPNVSPISQWGGSYVSGANASLSVSLEGAHPMSITWRKDGNVLNGANSTYLMLTNLTLADAGNYSVVVTNCLGSDTAGGAIIQVLPTNAPSIRVNNTLAVGTVTSPAPANISISGGFSGGQIFYTQDGSLPTTGGVLYTGSFSISNSCTLRAMSVSADLTQSSEAPPINLLVTYPLSTSVGGNGVVNRNPLGNFYLSNSVVVLTAVASTNWVFDHWAGDLTGSSNPASITMDGPRSVQAVFVPTAFPLTLTTVGGGSVTANGQAIGANTYYPSGTVVVVTASASTNWAFDHWAGDLTGSSNPASITMTGNRSVQAVFAQTVVPLTLSSLAGGTVTANGAHIPANTYYPTGDVVQLEATPIPGWTFLNWRGTVTNTANPFNLLMTQAQNVEAVFGTFVTTNIAGEGTVVMSVTNPVPYGTRLTNTAVPRPGNYLVTWSGAVSGTNNPVTFTVNYTTPAVGALFALSSSAKGQLKNLQKINSDFVCDLVGAAFRSYQIQYSTNLVAWSDLVVLTNLTGTVSFTNAMGDAGRYYRARLLP